MKLMCSRALVFKRHCRSRNELILLRMPITIVGTKFDSIKDSVKSTQSSVSIFDEHWHQEIFTNGYGVIGNAYNWREWHIHKQNKVWIADICVQRTHDCYVHKRKRRYDVKIYVYVPRVRWGTSVWVAVIFNNLVVTKSNMHNSKGNWL